MAGLPLGGAHQQASHPGSVPAPREVPEPPARCPVSEGGFWDNTLPTAPSEPVHTTSHLPLRTARQEGESEHSQRRQWGTLSSKAGSLHRPVTSSTDLLENLQCQLSDTVTFGREGHTFLKLHLMPREKFSSVTTGLVPKTPLTFLREACVLFLRPIS